MPRKIRDSNLETRAARGRLKVAHKPYFRLIEPGLHLGYRKLSSGPGSWVVRRYVGDGKYAVENLKTATGLKVIADDFADADGGGVVSFAEAQNKAKAQAKQRAEGPRTGPYLVRHAVEDYIAAKEADGRNLTDTRSRFNTHILPALGDDEVVRLTPDRIRKWHRGMAQEKPRTRTKVGKKQQYRASFNGDAEAVRRRQATANRTMTILKAALNMAFESREDIESDAAWRKVKPFKGVGKARVRYLSIAESKRLVNACDPDFRQLVQAGLYTGARYGAIAKLTVADFNADAGTLRLTTRKGDGTEKVFHATLTDEGARFFAGICAGRRGTALMFDGDWGRSEQTRPMKEACERAKIEPPATFYTLRHTFCSHAIMNGTPLLVVAKNLGHTDTRMVELHYGHLAPSYQASAIKKGAPTFGFEHDPKVVALH